MTRKYCLILFLFTYVAQSHAKMVESCDRNLVAEFIANVGAIECQVYGQIPCAWAEHRTAPMTVQQFVNVHFTTQKEHGTNVPPQSSPEELMRTSAFWTAVEEERARFFDAHDREPRTTELARIFKEKGRPQISAVLEFMTTRVQEQRMIFLKTLAKSQVRPLIASALAATGSSRILGALRVGGAGALGLAFTTATLTVIPSPTACNQVTEKHRANDSKCQPVYKLDDNVLHFLRLPPEDQDRLLSADPELCEYYKSYNRRLADLTGQNDIDLERVRCTSSSQMSIELSTNGKERVFDVNFDAQTGAVRTIYVSPVVKGSGVSDKYQEKFEQHALRFNTAHPPALQEVTLTTPLLMSIPMSVDQVTALLRGANPEPAERAMLSLVAAQAVVAPAQRCCSVGNRAEQSRCFKLIGVPNFSPRPIILRAGSPSESTASP